MKLSVKAKVAAAVTVFSVLLTALVLGGVLSTVSAAVTQNAEDNLRAASKEVKRQLLLEDGMVEAPEAVLVQSGVYTAVYSAEGPFLCGYMPSASLDSLDFKPGKTRSWGTWLVLDRKAQVEGYGLV